MPLIQPAPVPLTPSPSSAEEHSNASVLPGVNVLLEGPTGTGKTDSIGGLVETGVEVFYCAMEPGMESLLGYWTDRGLAVPENLHWTRIQTADYSWDAMIKAATDISSYTNEALAKIQDPNKQKHNQFIKLLRVLSNFPDERTGGSFGPVDRWGTERCLVVDALTGINTAAMSLVVGAKPIKTLVDWGIAMDQVERLIRQLTEGCKCHFVLCAHVEREPDPVGGSKITVGTLGTKLASKIPPMFSDVILCSREGTQFYWNTANSTADLKTRNLPIQDKMPSRGGFKSIIEKWKSRGGKFTPTRI